MRKLIICICVLALLGIDLCRSACPVVRSAKHGELFLSQGENLLENCEGLARFEQKKTGKIFCLKKKGEMPEKITCDNCQCGQENKPSSAELRVVGGANVEKNQFPWYAMMILLDNTNNATVGGENYKGKISYTGNRTEKYHLFGNGCF